MHILFGLVFLVLTIIGLCGSLGGVATFESRLATGDDIRTMIVISCATVVFAMASALSFAA